MFVFDYFRGETCSRKQGKDKVLGFANHKQHQLLLFISCSQKLVASKRFLQAHFLGNAYDGFAIE